MWPRTGTPFRILLTRMIHHASCLLRSLVIRRVRCQLWARLTFESLPGSHLLNCCSSGICCGTNSPANTHSLIFQRALVLMFTCSQLLGRQGGRYASIQVTMLSHCSIICWRRFTERYSFPWLPTRETGSLRCIGRIFCFLGMSEQPDVRHLLWKHTPHDLSRLGDACVLDA